MVEILRLAELMDVVGEGLRVGGVADVGVRFVVSPYRVNPLGAHVDHQGGAVLGRSIDLYTVLGFVPLEGGVHVTRMGADGQIEGECFGFDGGVTSAEWPRYLQAAVAALHAYRPLKYGIRGHVAGSLPGAGLSSSASVVLAYLTGLAAANDFELSQTELVELVRHVENIHLGLNNGVQDQMCIAFGQEAGLNRVDSLTRTVQFVPNPPNVDEVCWLLAYSGFSRELLGSGFNTRVAECREAARLLDGDAVILSDVSAENRTLSTLPSMLQRRASHYFSEVQRVEDGLALWAAGDWDNFGRKMNQSCHSSINHYESGTPPVNQLHEIMSSTAGVYGSRFCGGGYGGCVVALVDRTQAESAAATVFDRFVAAYPEKRNVASVFVANPENGIRIITP